MSASEEEILENISIINNDTENKPETTEAAKRKFSNDQQASADTSAINKRRKSEDNEDVGSSDKVTVKTEVLDEMESSSNNIPVTIKKEPGEDHDVSAAVDVSDVPTTSTSSSASSTIVIKTEASNDDPSVKTDVASSSTVVKTEPNSNTQSAIADSSVSSSTLRPSCRFGIKCYRRNLAHRRTEAHPGDSDYRRPSFPTPPLGTPACPFGNLCYRRNPIHFQQYSHPSD
ncbi:aprataxin and PNK-like factor isoform X3 [Drosophila hydei]|nr:aprataxin and PNK-like factor isoform X3 [Drosophila hydei]